mgnify:CR=1 FL=1
MLFDGADRHTHAASGLGVAETAQLVQSEGLGHSGRKVLYPGKEDPQALLAQKDNDAGISRLVLDERLEGVKKSLTESLAALASDGGD